MKEIKLRPTPLEIEAIAKLQDETGIKVTTRAIFEAINAYPFMNREINRLKAEVMQLRNNIDGKNDLITSFVSAFDELKKSTTKKSM